MTPAHVVRTRARLAQRPASGQARGVARHTGSAASDAPGAHARGAHPIERAHLRVPERPSPPVLRYAPSPAAAHLVRHYWVPVWEIPDGHAWEQHVLQYPCCLVVVAGGDDPYERFYGVVRGLSKVSLAGRGWVVGTVLQPGVGWLLGQALTAPGAQGWSVAAITDAWVPLGTLAGPWPGVIAAVRDAVAGDPHDPTAHRRAITSIETALLAEVTLDEEAGLVDAVVAAVETDPDLLRVSQLAERFAMSQRSLQRLTVRRLGLSPHWLIQRRRLHEAAERLRAGHADLAALAAYLGYADQAHFTRDFRTITGHTPADFRDRAGRAAHQEPEPSTPF